MLKIPGRICHDVFYRMLVSGQVDPRKDAAMSAYGHLNGHLSLEVANSLRLQR